MSKVAIMNKLSDAQSELAYLRSLNLVVEDKKEIIKPSLKLVKKPTAYNPSKDMDLIRKNEASDLFT